jgi:PqqD family protein of HPr-rel-A system
LHDPVDPRWVAASGLVWTQFDDSDDWVVFNPLSGDIHLLSAPAYALWRLATSTPPLSFTDVIDALIAESPQMADARFVESARGTLAFMDSAGLVVPVL